MGKVEGWKKIFPTELGRIDHFVDLVSSFLIETRTSVGVDKGVVRDVLVEARVKLVLAGLSLILGFIAYGIWNLKTSTNSVQSPSL